MTAEMQQLANDPNFVVQFAVGDPIPNLVPQSKDSGIRMSGAYFDITKRYIMKKAHMSKEDVSAPPPPPPRDVPIDFVCSAFFLSSNGWNSCVGSRVILYLLGEDIRRDHRPGRHGITPSGEEPIREARSSRPREYRCSTCSPRWGVGIGNRRNVPSSLDAELQDKAEKFIEAWSSVH
jgi:hypothetical protein